MKSSQWNITSLENENKEHVAELRSKEERMFALEEEVRVLKKMENIAAEQGE
jgi:hypothetical protein